MRNHHHDNHGGPHRYRHDSHDHRGFGQGRPERFGPGFGPGFGPRGHRRAGRGDVRLAILSLLSDAPSNGYGLIKAIAEKTAGAWRPSPGSVYPTLQQLVDEELISSTGDGRRTEFELTDAGRTYVEKHSDELAQAWAGAAGQSEAETQLFDSVGKLMGVIHQLRMSATDDQRVAATAKIDEARRALYLILAD